MLVAVDALLLKDVIVQCEKRTEGNVSGLTMLQLYVVGIPLTTARQMLKHQLEHQHAPLVGLGLHAIAV